MHYWDVESTDYDQTPEKFGPFFIFALDRARLWRSAGGNGSV
jgi:hypothetical protein